MVPDDDDDDENEYEHEYEIDDDSDDLSTNRAIQLVYRGACTFEDKSANAKEVADAVIVINELPDELFVMSSSTGEVSDEDDDYPTTVLVSGRDGADMLARIERQKGEGSSREYLSATISLIPQSTRIDQHPQVQGRSRLSGHTHWPAVHATPEALQIYSKSGWGVHAVQQQQADKVEWQLFLLHHQV